MAWRSSIKPSGVMGSLWCRDLKHWRIRIAERPKPKRVTVVMPYYENPKFFREQVRRWGQWSPDLREYVAFIVVDDGSPDPLVPPVTSVNLRVFRIEVDVRWNWLAARNIGAYHAETPWLLMTDMDHVIPESTMYGIVWGKLDEEYAYGFDRVEYTGRPIAPHSASFLMTKAVFWRVGGYDEALAGHYGTDGEFRRRLQSRVVLKILDAVLERHEFVEDASTERYQRKLPADAAGVRRLVAERPPDWEPKVMSFPYHEVTSCR